MSKLFKLKKIFSIEETAERLSSSLGEKVTSADVLMLAIDGHITISVIIENQMFGVWAKLGTTTYRKMFNINDDGSYKSIFGQTEHMAVELIDIEQEKIFKIGNIFEIPYDCYDLPMKWSEKLDVLWRYEQEKGKSPKQWYNLEGTFLNFEDHLICIMAPFNESKISWIVKSGRRVLVDKETNEPITEENYSHYFYPAGGLCGDDDQNDLEFVFKRENIEKFEQSLLEENANSLDLKTSKLLIASILKTLKHSKARAWNQGDLSNEISEILKNRGLGKRKIDEFFSDCNKFFESASN